MFSLRKQICEDRRVRRDWTRWGSVPFEVEIKDVLQFLAYFSNSTAAAIREAREREKKEMSELNDRLASYIEKVSNLEENVFFTNKYLRCDS